MRKPVPPIWMIYSVAPALGREQKDPTHSANFGVKLPERLRSLGVSCELVYPGTPDFKHASVQSLLVERLKAQYWPAGGRRIADTDRRQIAGIAGIAVIKMARVPRPGNPFDAC